MTGDRFGMTGLPTCRLCGSETHYSWHCDNDDVELADTDDCKPSSRSRHLAVSSQAAKRIGYAHTEFEKDLLDELKGAIPTTPFDKFDVEVTDWLKEDDNADQMTKTAKIYSLAAATINVQNRRILNMENQAKEKNHKMKAAMILLEDKKQKEPMEEGKEKLAAALIVLKTARESGTGASEKTEAHVKKEDNNE